MTTILKIIQQPFNTPICPHHANHQTINHFMDEFNHDVHFSNGHKHCEVLLCGFDGFPHILAAQSRTFSFSGDTYIKSNSEIKTDVVDIFVRVP